MVQNNPAFSAANCKKFSDIRFNESIYKLLRGTQLNLIFGTANVSSHNLMPSFIKPIDFLKREKKELYAMLLYFRHLQLEQRSVTSAKKNLLVHIKKVN
ncbi:hypothetical protein BpHYR1_007862 [Brachionus plicatilis]|uniref:Uncharacterized protein n=1 Tax=Brachionus plicatilis TaxID=10195 RepID=A0A3M7STS5_BRAPC|nr:hypothetical protein BpHYR1_007862 [Brachionus plicatilis]